MMNPALKRWSNKDERRSHDIVGIIDTHSSSRRHTQSNDRLIVTSLGPEFPDDLSTIAGDTIANTVLSMEGPPHTPEKVKHDESATLPETPQKFDSSTKSLSSFDYERSRTWCMCRVMTAAACMAFILLGAIAVLAVALQQMRHDEDVSNQGLTADKPNDGWLVNAQGLQGNASTLFPVETPSGQAIEQGQDDPIPLDSIRTMLLSTASTFYTNPDMLSMDPNSVHYQVMIWLQGDPSFSSYSTDRVLQRFALGVTYMSLTPGTTDLTQVGWMDYSDECKWPQSQNMPSSPTPSPSPCNPGGAIIAVKLEGMGFSGTIAPEIGLLSSLQFLALKNNNITGVLPTELGLLTRLRRLNLPENQITGTIPTELGFLYDLDVLSLGFNNLIGSVPSEFGTLTNLTRIDLQTNSLTGQLPEDLWAAQGLEYIELEYNLFSGPISPAIANLVNLRELSLQGNDFTGPVPGEVCAINILTVVTVDCEQVLCACCATCDNFFGLPANVSATATPTIAATIPATIPPTIPPTATATVATTIATTVASTIAPTINATTIAPTTIPTTMTPSTASTTSAPTLCQEVKTEKSCYVISEAIDFQIFNCNPSEQDVVALYRTQDLANSGTRIALFWVPSCMTVDCHWMISAGSLFGGNVTIMDTPVIQWPLAADEYKFLLFRIFQPDSLETLAESLPFRVADVC